MFGSFGWMELMLILIIVLIIFGAGKIPQLGEGLGKAIKGFKKSLAEADALDVTPNDDPEGSQAPPPQQVASEPQATQAPPPQQVASEPEATQAPPQEAPVQQPVEPIQPKQG